MFFLICNHVLFRYETRLQQENWCIHFPRTAELFPTYCTYTVWHTGLEKAPAWKLKCKSSTTRACTLGPAYQKEKCLRENHSLLLHNIRHPLLLTRQTLEGTQGTPPQWKIFLSTSNPLSNQKQGWVCHKDGPGGEVPTLAGSLHCPGTSAAGMATLLLPRVRQPCSVHEKLKSQAQKPISTNTLWTHLFNQAWPNTETKRVAPRSTSGNPQQPASSNSTAARIHSVSVAPEIQRHYGKYCIFKPNYSEISCLQWGNTSIFLCHKEVHFT